MNKRQQPPASGDYDLADFRITRVMRQAFRNSLLPIGNFGGGPGWTCLFALLFAHRLPYPFYRLALCLEHHAQMLIARFTGSFDAP